MAIRVYKPTSSARRFMSVLTYEEITKKTPEKSLTEYLKKNARPQQAGQDHRPSSGRRQQGQVPHHRLQARQATASPPRWPRSSTIPTAPPSSRCCNYADGEKRYILAPLGLKVGDTVHGQRNRRHQARQRAAHQQHPRWYADPQRGNQARPRRPDGSLRRRRTLS